MMFSLGLVQSWLPLAFLPHFYVVAITCQYIHPSRFYSNSRWQRGSVEVTVLEFANAIAPGDVLRELFSRQLLRAEFVLVTGDVVSNMRFDEVVQAHKYGQ
jgi:hypothetical protein